MENAEQSTNRKRGYILSAHKKGNNYIVDEENQIAKIELQRKNEENMWVIIDLDDLEKVISFPYTWFAKYSANAGSYYACASKYLPEIKHSRTVLMHQFIMGVDKSAREFNVDHKNHNTLDNRKENLRITNVPDNGKNRENRNKNNKSGYRNVSWNKSSQKWVVQLQINGKNTILGNFPKEQLEEAGNGEYAGLG